MSRYFFALAIFLGTLSTAHASRTPQQDRLTLTSAALLDAAVGRNTETGSAELVITDRTEVRVDGKTCEYSQVPENVEVELLEVGADKQTVVRIYFRRK